MAVLATLARPLSNKFADPGIHALVVHAVKSPCLGLHEADQLSVVEIGPIFAVFFRGQDAEICFAPQFFDMLAKLVADLPVNEPLRSLGREPPGVWMQELI